MDTQFEKDEQFTLDDFYDEKARKKRIKEEKKRRKSYKFSDKKHSKYGVLSSVLALFALIAIVLGIVLSTIHRGEAGSWLGTLSIFAFFATVVGICLAAFSFKQADIILKYSWTGLIANGILFFALGCIIIAGM